ncbi:hypothetical protein COLO4_05863 [Corchorus olitorius]|uniref:Uncharacterized protein n=1 Tax=Corchorus olitorius TaxID=93759 RepID=A0A1R3KPN4_9ROSI|nr:hypothetical protein COLO4_05863 [Corchorus olitorius]
MNFLIAVHEILIAGGIWANTIGGKAVLGFGVVWWSAATVLSPVAAKLGLPFLLSVHAFMGIGEGVAMLAMNNICRIGFLFLKEVDHLHWCIVE